MAAFLAEIDEEVPPLGRSPMEAAQARVLSNTPQGRAVRPDFQAMLSPAVQFQTAEGRMHAMIPNTASGARAENKHGQQTQIEELQALMRQRQAEQKAQLVKD